MSNSKKEQDGITALRNLLSLSSVMEYHIAERDKYPLWDGEIFLYDKCDHRSRKDALVGRAPVQVRSSKRAAKAKETYPFAITDLRAYLNDGGLLFIRPIFTAATEYKIFAKMLLATNINGYIRQSKKRGTKSISIPLEVIEGISDFEALVSHFLENRPHQSPVALSIGGQKAILGTEEFLVRTLTENHEDIIGSLFSDYAYVYARLPDNVLLSVDMQISSVQTRVDLPVRVDGEGFFTSFFLKRNKSGEKCIILNSALKFGFTSEKLTLSLSSKDEVLFVEFFNAVRFIKALQVHSRFELGETPIELTAQHKLLPREIKFERLSDINALLECFKVDTTGITISAIEKASRLISFLSGAILRKEPVRGNTTNGVALQVYELLGRKVLILFTRTSDSFFEASNYCTHDFDSDIRIRTTAIDLPVSRFVALTVMPEFVENVSVLDGYFDSINEDVLRYYDPALKQLYDAFMLGCIHGYDQTKGLEFLALADKLNQFMAPDRDSPDYDIYEVNRLQIIRRQRNLNSEEVQMLVAMKDRHHEAAELRCCILILLEYKIEFELLYESLDLKRKAQIRTWPIWRLYDSNT